MTAETYTSIKLGHWFWFRLTRYLKQACDEKQENHSFLIKKKKKRDA